MKGPDLKYYSDSILFSYSQIFFARNRPFALFLLIVTFFSPSMGISGLLSVIITNAFAGILGFSREAIRSGDYGFNSVLVGLGLGFYYALTPTLLILIVVGALITFLFTVLVAGVLQKYNLPYLSVPFLLALWALMLSSRNFTHLTLSEQGVYTLNELFATGSHWLVNIYQKLNALWLPEIVRIYFNSLGAILFQFNIISGVLIAIGLLIYSRIAFSLSFISFAAAYYYYKLLGADIATLSYSYIGFNFILSGIAIGSYFLVPSRWSYLWAVILVAPLMILASSLGSLFVNLQLGIYSLPFNIVIITFLYVLKLRHYPGQPEEVVVQHHTPEWNLYHNLSGKGRFKNYRSITITPPVFGQWKISQAHHGAHTHRGEWAHAWDFVLTDSRGSTFKEHGTTPKDYYCYDKPVIAPSDGIVEEVIDGIDDNSIGQVNLNQNWGNSIVINHGYQLYSQLSHFRKGTIKVKKGDNVKRGDVLGNCGNSGRSPEPHLHFQLQTTPYVGSKTLKYPLSHFLAERKGKTSYAFFGYPELDDHIKTVEVNPLLNASYHFLPGQLLHFDVEKNGDNTKATWEVKVDYYNNTYIQCLESGAKAFYYNDGFLFYFTQYQGPKNCLLYAFFLSSFRVMMGGVEGLKLHDEIPLHLYASEAERFVHDFFAPLYPTMKARFELVYSHVQNDIGSKKLTMHSRTKLAGALYTNRECNFETTLINNKIHEIRYSKGTQKVVATCTD